MTKVKYFTVSDSSINPKEFIAISPQEELQSSSNENTYHCFNIMCYLWLIFILIMFFIVIPLAVARNYFCYKNFGETVPVCFYKNSPLLYDSINNFKDLLEKVCPNKAISEIHKYYTCTKSVISENGITFGKIIFPTML